MQFRAAPILVALAAFTGALFALQSPADACSVAYMPYTYQTGQDNTPACLEVRGQTGYEDEETPQLFVENNCANAADFDDLECDSCQADLEVAPGETGRLDLVRSDMEIGDSSSQTYAWTVGDREGLVETTVHRQQATPDNASCSQPQPAGPLGSGHACAAHASMTGASNGPLDRPTLLLTFLFAASGLWLRRRA